MEDSQARKKGRRRSLRNIRRSSSNFFSANVSCLESNLPEDKNCGDVTAIAIHSYGSAWLGDENIDPLEVLNNTVITKENKAESLNENTCRVIVQNSDNAFESQNIRPGNLTASNSYIFESPAKSLVTETIDSPRYLQRSGLEKVPSHVCSPTVSDLRHGSNSSAPDSLPELDLSMYGSVDDCLGKQSHGFTDLQDNIQAPKAGNNQNLNISFQETLENLCGTDVKSSTFKVANTQDEYSLNDAFIDSNHDLLKPGEMESCNNMDNDLSSGNFVELSSQPSLNDVEMQPLCENESVNEPCPIPSPKIRKVSMEGETSAGLLASRNIRNSPESSGSNSTNKTSSFECMSMLSAIQSLTLELEALSAISDSGENRQAKLSNNDIESACKLEPTQLDSDKSIPGNDLKKISVNHYKSRKHLSLNRRSTSAAVTEEKQDKVRLLENVSNDFSGATGISYVEDGREELENRSVSDLQTNGCNTVNLECLESTTSQIKDRVDNSQILDPAAFKSELEAKLLEEISQRFPNDGQSLKKKTYNKRVLSSSSRRRSSQWFNLPNSNSDIYDQNTENISNENGVTVLDASDALASKVSVSLENSQSIVVNLTDAQDNQLHPAGSCERDQYKEQTNNVFISELGEATPLEVSLRFPKTKPHKKRVSSGSSRRRSLQLLSLPSSYIDVHDQYTSETSSSKVFVSSENSQSNATVNSIDARITDTRDNQSNPVRSCERVPCEEQTNHVLQYSSQSSETVSEDKVKERGKKSRRRSAPVTFGRNNESVQIMNIENQVTKEISDEIVSNREEGRDQIMEDSPPMTVSFSETESEKDKLAHSVFEEIDFTKSTLKSQGESEVESLELLETDEADVRPLRRSTRSQRTCKRKSWVIPTAGEKNSLSNDMQTNSGTKLAGNTDLPGGVAGQLDDAMDEFEVDESLRLLYLNKPYTAPPSSRPWETIKENPTNRDIFSCRRYPRLLTFQERISHAKLMKRHRKASVLNTISQNQRAYISHEEFQFRLEAVDKTLSS